MFRIQFFIFTGTTRVEFYTSSSGQWKEIIRENEGGKIRLIPTVVEPVRTFTTQRLLQSENLIILAGSGASFSVRRKQERLAPGMKDLWNEVEKATGSSFRKIISRVRYDAVVEAQNIESLLSRCHNHLATRSDEGVDKFVATAERVIAARCGFVTDDVDLAVHRQFLMTLIRARGGRSRPSIFTTNYDLAFERAASLEGLIAIDGFSHTFPQEYDVSYFDYDLTRTIDGTTTPVKGVFRLLKLHGSVDWRPAGRHRIERQWPCDRPKLIYPRDSKYQTSFEQPYLELLARFQLALRQKNTAVIVIGFGFNDFHIVQPLRAAIDSRPDLRLAVVDPFLKNSTNDTAKYLEALVRSGDDRIMLFNGTFDEYVEAIDHYEPSAEELLRQRVQRAQRTVNP